MKLSDIYGTDKPPRPGPRWAAAIKKEILSLASDISAAREKRSKLKEGDEGGMKATHIAQDYAFAVEFGNTTVAYPDAYGDLTTEGCSVSPTLRARLRTAKVISPAGALPIAGVITGFPTPAGVIIVTGAGGAGKTPVSHVIADTLCRGDEQGFGLVRYGEPFLGYLKTELQAARELAFLMTQHKAVAIDSFKDALTTMSGALMDSGLSRNTLPFFSRLSMLASELGVTIVAPINPSSPKASVVDLIAEIARSNVAMAVLGERDIWTVIARRGEGMLRDAGRGELSFVNGIPEFTIEREGTLSDDDVESVLNEVGAARGLAEAHGSAANADIITTNIREDYSALRAAVKRHVKND